MSYQRVQLKVCEGCGALWVRQEVGVYCGPCEEILRQFPDPKTRLRPGRPKKVRVGADGGGMYAGVSKGGRGMGQYEANGVSEDGVGEMRGVGADVVNDGMGVSAGVVRGASGVRAGVVDGAELVSGGAR